MSGPMGPADESEISDDELYERVRRKFLSEGGLAPSGLDEEAQRIAHKLMGTGRGKQLDRAARTGGRFRYRRPIVRAEYWCGPATYPRAEAWTIEVIEDGVRRPFKTSLTEDECNFVVRAISRRGIPVAKVVTEYMRVLDDDRRRAKQIKPISRRQAILNEMKGMRF